MSCQLPGTKEAVSVGSGWSVDINIGDGVGVAFGAQAVNTMTSTIKYLRIARYIIICPAC
jgi:hypothetical protein